MAPSSPDSAALTRCSIRPATSSTRSWSAANASCSAAAWVTRSVLSPARTTCWAGGTGRRRTAATPATINAASASAHAASAAMPAGSVSSPTARLPLREEGVVLRAVVVLLLLAGHRPDLDGDRDRGAERRVRRQAQRRPGGRAPRPRRGGLPDLDRLRAALDLEDHLDVELVVLAAVGEVHRELGVWAVGDPVGRRGVERDVAHGDGVELRAVQARLGRAAARAAPGRELLASASATVAGSSHCRPGRN